MRNVEENFDWLSVNKEKFVDDKWQTKNTISKIDQLVTFLKTTINVDPDLLSDLISGIQNSHMNIRLTPYILSRINWENIYHDPIRKQYLPLASEMEEPHPFCVADSLNEDEKSPVIGLVHRYPNKVLFLALKVCPVYCTYCTRSRMIGGST